MKFSCKINIAIVFFTIQAINLSAITSDTKQSPTPTELLNRLKDGNEKYLKSHKVERTKVALKQHPFAVVLCCADSRVTPELIFNQKIGSLFVVRVAGNTINNVILGSIEYALQVLGATLIVVLGHERCGAVQAALDLKKSQKPYSGNDHIKDVVNAIMPAIKNVKVEGDDALPNAIKANIKFVVNQLRNSKPIIGKLANEGTIDIIGADYDLNSGKVIFFENPEIEAKK